MSNSIYGLSASTMYGILNDYSNLRNTSFSLSSNPSDYYGQNQATTSAEAKQYLTDIKGFSDSLKNAAEKITSGNQSVFNATAATSDNDEAVSVNVTNSYTINNFTEKTVDVKQVASAQKNTGTAVDAAEKFGESGVSSFTISKGDNVYNIRVETAEGDTNKAVQQKMADAINNQDIGLKATVAYDEKTKQSSLVIESKETGEKNAFSIEDKSGSLVSKFGAAQTSTEAKDAVYSIDGGLDRKSSSNSVYLGYGVTAELKSEAENVKIGTKKDTTSIVNAMYDFVNNYNGLLDTARDYDSTGSGKIAKELTGAYKTFASKLDDAGITADSNGYLKVDTDKLKSAIEKGTAETALGVSKGASGFVSRVNQTAKNISQKPSQYIDYQTSASESGSNSYYSFNSKLSNLTGVGLLLDAMF